MYILILRRFLLPITILGLFTGSIIIIARNAAVILLDKLIFSPSLFVWYLYCQVLNGPFCQHDDEETPTTVGALVNVVNSSATSASDIFQSVVNLADPYSLLLHQSEIFELALTIQCSPTLEENDKLAGLIWNFGGVVRKLKDELGYINSKAITTFSVVGLEVSPSCI